MIRMIIIIVAIFYSATTSAGAWVQAKGHGLNILSLQRYISTHSWSSGGRIQGSPTYAKNQIDEYFEYGLTERLTVGLYFSSLQSHTTAIGTLSGANDH